MTTQGGNPKIGAESNRASDALLCRRAANLTPWPERCGRGLTQRKEESGDAKLRHQAVNAAQRGNSASMAEWLAFRFSLFYFAAYRLWTTLDFCHGSAIFLGIQKENRRLYIKNQTSYHHETFTTLPRARRHSMAKRRERRLGRPPFTEEELSKRIGLPLICGFEDGLGSWAAIGGRLPSGVDIEFVCYTHSPASVILRADKNVNYFATLDEALQLAGLSRGDVRVSPLAEANK
jgi:hypothetical protein